VAFGRVQDEKDLMVNGVWQMAHRIGKFTIDFSLQSGESLVGEIERQIFP